MLLMLSHQLVGKDATRQRQSPNNVLMRCSEIEEGSLITSSLISNSGASIRSYNSNDQLQNNERYSADPVGYSSPAQSGIVADLGHTSTQASTYSSSVLLGKCFLAETSTSFV
ncbi:hypothetical protein WN943_007601 [Citrus x changshan-huyou]